MTIAIISMSSSLPRDCSRRSDHDDFSSPEATDCVRLLSLVLTSRAYSTLLKNRAMKAPRAICVFPKRAIVLTALAGVEHDLSLNEMDSIE
jgi:hypothetical protein